MDYQIHREKAVLDSTGYMEIGPGRYSGKHWQQGFLFVWEDAFGMAEGILAKHVANYDHFSMIDIPKHVGEKVVAEWRDVADRLEDMSSEQAHTALNLSAAYRDRVDGTPMNDAKTPEDAEELEDLLEAARGANWDAQHGPKHLRSGRYFSYEKPTSQGGASVARDAVVEPGIEDSRPLRGRRLTPTTFGGQGVRHLRAIPGYRDQ